MFKRMIWTFLVAMIPAVEVKGAIPFGIALGLKPVISYVSALIGSGIIGDVNCMNISLAHEYHGVSLMRAYLGIRPDENFTVSGKMYEFPNNRNAYKNMSSLKRRMKFPELEPIIIIEEKVQKIFSCIFRINFLSAPALPLPRIPASKTNYKSILCFYSHTAGIKLCPAQYSADRIRQRRG